MTAKVLDKIKHYVNDHIVDQFHAQRLQKIQGLKLKDVLKRKNPYLFRAKNLISAPELTASILDAFLSSSEESSFGTFMEGLAVHVASLIYGGQKASGDGLDLDFMRDGIRYLVSIKSGPNWGNKSQYDALEVAFRKAVTVVKQGVRYPVQPVLGICYGNTRKVDTGLYLKVHGQDFWELVSGDINLYTDLIEPVGYEARKHDDSYQEEKIKLYTRFTKEFIDDFCHTSGLIDWNKLVKFSSQTVGRPSRINRRAL